MIEWVGYPGLPEGKRDDSQVWMETESISSPFKDEGYFIWSQVFAIVGGLCVAALGPDGIVLGILPFAVSIGLIITYIEMRIRASRARRGVRLVTHEYWR